MPIFIDDERVELAGDDLAGVLAAAKRRLAEAGRVVVEVHLDGEPLTGEALEGSQTMAVADRELRLVSADPKALALTTLEQVKQRLGEARQIQAEAAELLQQDAPADAMRKVSEAVEIWLQTQQAVLHSAVLVGVDLNSLRVDGEPIDAFTEDLIAKLKGLREAITAYDTVGLADTLAYEWPETTDRWEKLVERVMGEVREA